MVRLSNAVHLSSETPDDLKREIANLRADLKLISEFLNKPQFNGKILKDQAVTTTAANYYHGLERNWTGFVIVKKDASCDVRESSGDYDRRNLIRLVGSASATVDILVF